MHARDAGSKWQWLDCEKCSIHIATGDTELRKAPTKNCGSGFCFGAKHLEPPHLGRMPEDISLDECQSTSIRAKPKTSRYYRMKNAEHPVLILPFAWTTSGMEFGICLNCRGWPHQNLTLERLAKV